MRVPVQTRDHNPKSAESRYSPVEGECLAVADALHRSKHFVLGCSNLLIATHPELVQLREALLTTDYRITKIYQNIFVLTIFFTDTLKMAS